VLDVERGTVPVERGVDEVAHDGSGHLTRVPEVVAEQPPRADVGRRVERGEAPLTCRGRPPRWGDGRRRPPPATPGAPRGHARPWRRAPPSARPRRAGRPPR